MLGATSSQLKLNKRGVLGPDQPLIHEYPGLTSTPDNQAPFIQLNAAIEGSSLTLRTLLGLRIGSPLSHRAWQHGRDPLTSIRLDSPNGLSE